MADPVCICADSDKPAENHPAECPVRREFEIRKLSEVFGFRPGTAKVMMGGIARMGGDREAGDRLVAEGAYELAQDWMAEAAKRKAP
jgi:hypothetical protein